MFGVVIDDAISKIEGQEEDEGDTEEETEGDTEEDNGGREIVPKI